MVARGEECGGDGEHCCDLGGYSKRLIQLPVTIFEREEVWWVTVIE